MKPVPVPKPLPKGARQRPWGAGGGRMQNCIQGRCIVIRKRHVNGIAYMSSVNDLLDKVREAGNFPSDNALAQRLGMTRAVVSTWRSGRNPIPDERIAQLCALGKLDGPLWIAMIHAERAQSATERALWRLMLDRMGAAAAVVALVALSLPSAGNAKTAQIQAVSEGLLTDSVYYVQRQIRAQLTGSPGQPPHSQVFQPSVPVSAPNHSPQRR